MALARESSLFGIPLPPAICGLVRGDITNNELTNPGKGYTVQYEGPTEKATIYIYDDGLSDIPNNPTSEVVQQHFEICVQQVLAMKDVGLYSMVEVKDKYDIGDPKSGVDFVCCEFTVRESDKPMDSFLFLTACCNKFVKLRYTTTQIDHSWDDAGSFAHAVSKLLWPDRDRAGAS